MNTMHHLCIDLYDLEEFKKRKHIAIQHINDIRYQYDGILYQFEVVYITDY